MLPLEIYAPAPAGFLSGISTLETKTRTVQYWAFWGCRYCSITISFVVSFSPFFFLRYLPRLAATLRCNEPVLHTVRSHSALLPATARTGPCAEPEGEESRAQPNNQAWDGGWHCHGHACQYWHPRCWHELHDCKWCQDSWLSINGKRMLAAIDTFELLRFY